MQTEYEATFINIDHDICRKKLLDIGALCIKSEYTQMRTTFALPKGHEMQGGFLRVRDEGNRVTMTLKQFVRDGSINSQKETELVIDDYTKGVELLAYIGATIKAVQETKREIREYQGIQIMLDTRPFLESFVEIEGSDEQGVKELSEQLGYKRSEAVFDSVTELYARKYDISHDRINEQTPEIRFDMQNPFL